MERPEIVIPMDGPSRTSGGNGPYVHLVKERLMGMYLTVYVYKGCEHLVQGESELRVHSVEGAR
jgi:hypothetical protein